MSTFHRMDFGPFSLTIFSLLFLSQFSLSLSLFHKTEERLQFTKMSNTKRSKISHQTQGTKETLSCTTIVPRTFFIQSLFLSLSRSFFSLTIQGVPNVTRMFERISKRERPMGRSASPFLPKQAPRLLLNRVKKIYRMSYYIQVGMKNKKYFLAIFPFITIFLGYGAGDGKRQGREEGGREKARKEKVVRSMRTETCVLTWTEIFFFREECLQFSVV